MKKLIFMLLFVVFPVGLSTESIQTEYWVPQNPPKAHYRIECSIDPNEATLEGREDIYLKNTAIKPICKLSMKWLRQDGQIMKIKSNDKSVRLITDTNTDIILFELPEPLNVGEDVNLHVEFSGVKAVQKLSNKMEFLDWHPRLWWGFENHENIDVKIETNPEYTLVTTGLLDSKSGYYHAEGVRSFAVILCKKHNIIAKNTEDVIVRCVYTSNAEKCAHLLLDTAVDVINFYRKRFGFYPSKCLTIIPGMNSPAGGYPVATNIVAVHGMEEFDSMPKYHWQWITAHEIGHQYCGEYMLSEDPTNSFNWLMIALGIYADREYTLARKISSEKHQGLMEDYIRGVRAGFDTTMNITPEQQARIQFDFNNVVKHGKSYSFISALDCVLGNETFSKIYQRCLKEFGGRRLGVSEFQAICEEVSRQDLGWFFEQWVNSNKFLSYEISSQKSDKVDSRYKSKIEVKCLGSLKMPIPVAAYFEDGSSQVKFTDRLLDTSVVDFESSSPLKEVRLDPANKLAMVVPPLTSDSKVLGEAPQLPWSGAGEKTIELFKQAKQLQADSKVWFKIGLNLYDGRYYPEALESFQHMIVAPNKNIEGEFVSLVWQGHILDILKQREKALEYYHKALNLYSNSGLSGFTMRHDQWGMVIDQKWVEERIKQPFQPPSLNEQEIIKKIQQLPWTGAGNKALNVFNEVKESNLSNPDNWLILGLTLYDGQYYKEALVAFKRTQELSEKTSFQYPVSLVWQGHIYDLLGQRQDALKLYETFLKESGDFQVQHDQYGIKIDRDWVKERLKKPFERNVK